MKENGYANILQNTALGVNYNYLNKKEKKKKKLIK